MASSEIVKVDEGGTIGKSVKHGGSSKASSIGPNPQGPENPGADANMTMSVVAGRHIWVLTASAMAVDTGEHGRALLQTTPPLPHVGAPRARSRRLGNHPSAVTMDAGEGRVLKPIGSHGAHLMSIGKGRKRKGKIGHPTTAVRRRLPPTVAG
jgi:hypothetical protein